MRYWNYGIVNFVEKKTTLHHLTFRTAKIYYIHFFSIFAYNSSSIETPPSGMRLGHYTLRNTTVRTNPVGQLSPLGLLPSVPPVPRGAAPVPSFGETPSGATRHESRRKHSYIGAGACVRSTHTIAALKSAANSPNQVCKDIAGIPPLWVGRDFRRFFFSGSLVFFRRRCIIDCVYIRSDACVDLVAMQMNSFFTCCIGLHIIFTVCLFWPFAFGEFTWHCLHLVPTERISFSRQFGSLYASDMSERPPFATDEWIHIVSRVDNEFAIPPLVYATNYTKCHMVFIVK